MKIVIDDEKIIDLLETEWGYEGIREDARRLLIENGTSLDDVKAIMKKQIERDFAYAETETFKVPCHYGTANGLQVAVRILDSIGKSETQKPVDLLNQSLEDVIDCS